jgi:hypothetical protein
VNAGGKLYVMKHLKVQHSRKFCGKPCQMISIGAPQNTKLVQKPRNYTRIHLVDFSVRYEITTKFSGIFIPAKTKEMCPHLRGHASLGDNSPGECNKN